LALAGDRSEYLKFAKPAFEGERLDAGAVEGGSHRPIEKVAAVEIDFLIHVIVHRHYELGVPWVDLLPMVDAKEGNIAGTPIANVGRLVLCAVHHSGGHLEVNVVRTKWLGAEVCERDMEPVVMPLRLYSLLRIGELDLSG